jgi:hypothetical protein
VCVYIYIFSSGVANPDPKELQAKMHNAGIVLGWVYFLALDFWCSLPSWVRWVNMYSQPTMWEPRETISLGEIHASRFVHAHMAKVFTFERRQ